MSQVNLITSALDFEHQDRISLKTILFCKNIEQFFITPSNVNFPLLIYWFKVGGTPVFYSGYLLETDHLIPGGMWFFFMIIHFVQVPA